MHITIFMIYGRKIVWIRQKCNTYQTANSHIFLTFTVTQANTIILPCFFVF